MVLLFHIVIALSGIISSAFSIFSPSKKKITLSYIFVAATIISGSYLIYTKPAHMVQTCFEGVAYITFVTAALARANKKLAKEANQ